jgi:hypothetical protein
MRRAREVSVLAGALVAASLVGGCGQNCMGKGAQSGVTLTLHLPP